MLPLQHRQEVRTDPLLRSRMLIIGLCGCREALTDSFCFDYLHTLAVSSG